ncbi:MAG: OmpH family outer membrane protein [Candidatus Thiocaldithrix dubininis]|uniref:OmpH family outer membrane protein n=1 Tax=Candidatus Thiocaldithrix dubininis TaxID=3080823 RepID=A0AA95KJL5_9GAMM|nr:MAG: OmpH family outer membrane protein [Candidatus Thiocaldithrix dubininis]
MLTIKQVLQPKVVLSTALGLALSILFFAQNHAIAESNAVSVGIQTSNAPKAINSMAKIATVNIAQLMEKSPQTKSASEKLKADYAKREQELETEKRDLQAAKDDLTQKVAEHQITETELVQLQRDLRSRERLYVRTQEDFNNELNAARDLAVEKVQNQVFQAIEAVRAEQEIDIVFKESDYITASKRIDLTDKVLLFLEKQSSATANTSTYPTH